MSCSREDEHSARLHSETSTTQLNRSLWYLIITLHVEMAFLFQLIIQPLFHALYKTSLRWIQLPLFCSEHLCKQRHPSSHLRCEVITRASLLRRKTLAWGTVPANKTHQPLHWKSLLRFVQVAHVDCAYKSKSRNKLPPAPMWTWWLNFSKRKYFWITCQTV